MRLRKSVRARWVAALRSGKYKQGTGVLRREYHDERNQEFCCLGVLCELAIEDGLSVRVGWDGGRVSSVAQYEGAPSYPPDRVNEWAGYGYGGPEHGDTGPGFFSLADMNDGGYTFEQIADLIESDPDAVNDYDDVEVKA